MANHAVILGSGRSGTSIFGELFECIPEYTYYSESAFEDVINLKPEGAVAIKVPRESIRHPAPPGLSFPIHKMITTFSKTPVFFWQVRHPLDTVASLRPGISNNWGHHPRPRDWQEWLDRPLIEKCAHHWAYINTVGYEAVKDFVEVCHFEPMIRDPMSFALKICSKVEVNPDDFTPELTSWADRVQDTNNAKFIEAKTSRNLSRPDHNIRIGRWKENLSEEEVIQIIPILDCAAKTFGYDISNEPAA